MPQCCRCEALPPARPGWIRAVACPRGNGILNDCVIMANTILQIQTPRKLPDQLLRISPEWFTNLQDDCHIKAVTQKTIAAFSADWRMLEMASGQQVILCSTPRSSQSSAAPACQQNLSHLLPPPPPPPQTHTALTSAQPTPLTPFLQSHGTQTSPRRLVQGEAPMDDHEATAVIVRTHQLSHWLLPALGGGWHGPELHKVPNAWQASRIESALKCIET